MARSSASAAAWNCGREGLRNFHLADLCVIGTCDAATGGSALARAGGRAVALALVAECVVYATEGALDGSETGQFCKTAAV